MTESMSSVWIVSDEELSELPPEEAKALFARSEAQGAGDYELSAAPNGESGWGYVEDYNVAMPEWTPQFLARVQKNLASLTMEDVRRLTADLHGSPDQQAEALRVEGSRIETELRALIDAKS